VKERPIIFSTEMVQAILEDRKTQTRRIIKPQPLWEESPTLCDDNYWRGRFETLDKHSRYPDIDIEEIKCPYGIASDRLWVRETWRAEELDPYGEDGIRYKADRAFIQIENSQKASEKWLDARYTKKGDRYPDGQWRPSIFMPRWASRITLEIKDVKVERVQKITEEDAIAEGCAGAFLPADCEFELLWNSFNAKRGYGWNKNPWVWVVKFVKSGGVNEMS